MAKFGSIKYQVVEILKTVNGIGESKKQVEKVQGLKVWKAVIRLAIKSTATNPWTTCEMI